MHLLGQYGLRDYNEPFNNRDSYLWTVGAHAVWELSEDTELFFGYHFEKGDAKNKYAANLINDDVSYISNYASIVLEHKFF